MPASKEEIVRLLMLDEKYRENPELSGNIRLLEETNQLKSYEVLISEEEMKLLDGFPREQRAELYHQYNSLKDGYDTFADFLVHVKSERMKLELAIHKPKTLIIAGLEGEKLKDRLILYLIDTIKTISTTKSRLGLDRFAGEGLLIFEEELELEYLENRKLEIHRVADKNEFELRVIEKRIRLGV